MLDRYSVDQFNTIVHDEINMAKERNIFDSK